MSDDAVTAIGKAWKAEALSVSTLAYFLLDSYVKIGGFLDTKVIYTGIEQRQP